MLWTIQSQSTLSATLWPNLTGGSNGGPRGISHCNFHLHSACSRRPQSGMRQAEWLRCLAVMPLFTCTTTVLDSTICRTLSMSCSPVCFLKLASCSSSHQHSHITPLSRGHSLLHCLPAQLTISVEFVCNSAFNPLGKCADHVAERCVQAAR